jgi:hypothetical protein
MFAPKSLTMRAGRDGRFTDEALELVAMRRVTDKTWLFGAVGRSRRRLVLFKIVLKYVYCPGAWRKSPRMSLTASMFGRAMARALSAPSARTLSV